jgi:hypothetical protein
MKKSSRFTGLVLALLGAMVLLNVTSRDIFPQALKLFSGWFLRFVGVVGGIGAPCVGDHVSQWLGGLSNVPGKRGLRPAQAATQGPGEGRDRHIPSVVNVGKPGENIAARYT